MSGEGVFIIVGVEDVHNDAGNKMMFMAQAVRYVRRYKHLFDLTSVLYFEGEKGSGVEMTPAQCEKFEAAVKQYGGVPTRVTDWSEVADHINRKTVTIGAEKREKKVQVLVFFAHGVPGSIWLSSEEKKYFKAAQAATVDASSFLLDNFDNSCHVTSWACQTGNAGDPAKTAEENMAASLAQAMADMWDIKVYASPTRTDYSETWGGGLGVLSTTGVDIVPSLTARSGNPQAPMEACRPQTTAANEACPEACTNSCRDKPRSMVSVLWIDHAATTQVRIATVCSLVCFINDRSNDPCGRSFTKRGGNGADGKRPL